MEVCVGVGLTVATVPVGGVEAVGTWPRYLYIASAWLRTNPPKGCQTPQEPDLGNTQSVARRLPFLTSQKAAGSLYLDYVLGHCIYV